MSFLDDICNKEWKVYGLVFVSCFILIGLSNYYLLQPHMRFKGKAKKLNVSYFLIAKTAIMSAIIATAFAFLANKMPKYNDNDDSQEKSYKPIDEDDEDYERRRRRRKREERREERRDEPSRESGIRNNDYPDSPR